LKIDSHFVKDVIKHQVACFSDSRCYSFAANTKSERKKTLEEISNVGIYALKLQ